MTFRFLWKLVFRGGLLSGQELHLPEGQLTVGSGNQWDINLLCLEQHDQQHAILDVSQDGVYLQPELMSCKVDNRRVKRDRIAIQPGQIIKIGSCTFTLARVGENTATYPIAQRHRWMQIWGVALPGSLAAGILVTLLYASQELRASVPKPELEPFSIEQYQQTLKDTGLAQISVERDPSGALTLSGTCWSNDKLQPFLNRLVEAGVAYRNQVICQDDLQRSVAYILHANGYHNARVNAGTALGAVSITGNIRADEQWNHVSQQLNRLPGLLSWSVSNRAEQNIESLIAQLRENNLLSKLSIAKQDDILVVTGQLQEEQQQALQHILGDYQQQQKYLRVVYQDIPTSQQEASIFLNDHITSYSGNAQSASLQLASGTQVQVGSTLRSGYTITALDSAGVELQKEGQLVHLPLGLQ